MTLDQIQRAAEIAKSRTTDKRWQNAIDKAVAGFESWIVTELADHILVTTENGTYHANGACQCKAYTEGGKSACKHRALYRLIQIAREAEAAEEAARRCDVIIEDIKEIAAEVVATEGATSRADVIASIEKTWSRTQTTPLYTELLARFGKSKLEMLDDDMLRRVRLAIAL